MKVIEDSISKLEKNAVKKIKLSLNKWGGIKIDISDLLIMNGNVTAIISQNKINSNDRFRYFKTTNRNLYDREHSLYASDGFDEVIYLNENEEITEGSKTNLFLRRGDSWFTPAVQSGILSGIYRKYFLVTNSDVTEKNLKLDDIVNADELILTNAIQGEVKVAKLFLNKKEFIPFQS